MAEAKKRRGKQAKSVKPADPIPYGTKIVDTQKKDWVFGKEIGSGGCGVVYEGSSGSSSAFNFVIKVEYHENGSLFTEMHVYHHIGKQETRNNASSKTLLGDASSSPPLASLRNVTVAQFAKKKRLSFLGIPVCHGSGSFVHNNNKYRFMVLEKYGKDMQRVLDENGNKLHPKTVFTIGNIVINSLEYIHSLEYVHGDIKAGNLLLGPSKDTINNVYLLDMGLAARYITKDGLHKSDKPDPRKADNGTAEFMSRDAHAGVFSRRSDLEILGYNMLLWLSCTLPWLKVIGDPAKLKAEKNRFMNDVPLLMKSLFPHPTYPELEEYLAYVNRLGFEEAPGYDYCISLFKRSIQRLGLKDDGILILKGSKIVQPLVESDEYSSIEDENSDYEISSSDSEGSAASVSNLEKTSKTASGGKPQISSASEPELSSSDGQRAAANVVNRGGKPQIFSASSVADRRYPQHNVSSSASSVAARQYPQHNVSSSASSVAARQYPQHNVSSSASSVAARQYPQHNVSSSASSVADRQYPQHNVSSSACEPELNSSGGERTTASLVNLNSMSKTARGGTPQISSPPVCIPPSLEDWLYWQRITTASGASVCSAPPVADQLHPQHSVTSGAPTASTRPCGENDESRANAEALRTSRQTTRSLQNIEHSVHSIDITLKEMLRVFKNFQDMVDNSSDSRSSQKENNHKKKAEKKKRVNMDASSSNVLPSGEVLTPAMLAVLNRQQEKAAEKATKKPRKKAE